MRELLEEVPDVDVIGEAASGAEVLESAKRLAPDVVLLDYQMPAMNGLQVCGVLPPSAVVIFVTAYEDYAIGAFNVGAVDYLLKPVRRERLQAALEKARVHLRGRQSAASAPAQPTALRKIVGRLGQELHLIDPDDVVAFQAQGDLVYVITAKGRYYATHSLRALEKRLPPNRFRRVHRSTIVNADLIRKISPLSSRRWLLRMANGMEVIVSKRMASIIREQTRW